MKAFFHALGFLTVLPVPAKYRAPDGHELSQSAAWFPAVGLVPGVLLALTAMAVKGGLAPQLGAIAAIIAITLITGAIHVDGLSDWADGLGGKTPEESYRIMKDSRVGSFGAIAIVLVMLAKYASFGRLFASGAGVGALIVIPVLARWALPITMWNAAHASATGGVASAFLTGESDFGKTVLRGTLVTFAICFIFFRLTFLWLFLVALAIAIGMRLDSKRRLGGVTGDVLGAQCELSETAMFIIAAQITG